MKRVIILFLVLILTIIPFFSAEMITYYQQIAKKSLQELKKLY